MSRTLPMDFDFEKKNKKPVVAAAAASKSKAKAKPAPAAKRAAPEPEVLRSSGRVRKPRQIVHLGADSFYKSATPPPSPSGAQD